MGNIKSIEKVNGEMMEAHKIKWGKQTKAEWLVLEVIDLSDLCDLEMKILLSWTSADLYYDWTLQVQSKYQIKQLINIPAQMTSYLYSNASAFNDSLYILNEDQDECSLFGGYYGPIQVQNIVPTTGPLYKFQINATFGSGEGDHGKQKQKKETFTTNIPVHKKKVFSPPPKDHKDHGFPPSIVKAWEKGYPYVVQPQSKDQKQKAGQNKFDPSGTIDGTYAFHNAPWPSNYRVWLIINFALQWYGDQTIFQFGIADDPETMTDLEGYAGYFDVADFTTSGSFTKTAQLGSTYTYALNPTTTTYFKYTSLN